MNKLKLTLISFLLLIVVTKAQNTLIVTPGTPNLDGVISAEEWTSSALVTAAGVELNAMADGQYLYISASWSDETESIQKNEWSFDGSSWSKSGNEDRFSFVWDVGENGSDGANCATMCHGDGLMRTNTGKVDVWHWKAARGNAVGFVDDKYWSTDDRHSDDGTSAYSDNSNDGTGKPSFMASGDPGANTNFLGADAATINAYDPFQVVSPHRMEEAIAFDENASFNSGDVIPGYILRIPQGDRASVQSAGRYEDGVWTVEFKRPYAGSENDFEVVPGSSVDFTHEIFDNTGGSHPNDGFDATVYSLDFSQIPTQKTSLVVTPGTPNLDGIISPGEWTSSALVTTAGVELNAMADGQYLYISASWSDETESIQKNEWSFDGSSWSKTGNEDRIGFVWDMDENGSDGANCATMCHGDGLMRTNIGKVDAWHWKAARGNALGVADDKYWSTDDRHSDAGTSAYSDNSDDGTGKPSFMASGDPGANISFLALDAATVDAYDPFQVVSPHKMEEATAFDENASFNSGDVIPGYILRIPQGDRASVQSAGRYEDGVWTVEFKRLYAGSENDFEVLPGSSVDFTHEIFDNTGGSHPNDGFDATVYSLDFGLITNIEENKSTSGEILTDYVLSQNYPNPFNPTTTIEFKITDRNFVSIKVYDVLGKEIKTLVNQEMSQGVYSIKFDSENLSSGIYFYKIEAGSFVDIKKMILMK
ncbi:ethylbenzene dehydrogenase-related protein [Bacteroidota bacterium]